MTIHNKQLRFDDVDDDYKKFVDKFKPKKTTDDCHTPENIYNAVADWAARRYGFSRAQIVRPFWPGENYQYFDYPDGCIVLDNPPFSILSEIIHFYCRHKIRYFLFAPSLTLFSTSNKNAKYLQTHATITYENGARVNTGFVTSEGEWLAESCPELRRIIEKADKENRAKDTKQVRKLGYPDDVLTAAALGMLASRGESFRLKKEDCCFIRDLDNLRGGIFGGGFLLSERAAAERAAAERAAAERAAAEKIELSDREKNLQKRLGDRDVLSGKTTKGTENDT